MMLLYGAMIWMATQSAVPSVVKLQTFDYKDVTLTGGALDDQAKGARRFYLDLSEDSLLQGFRLRAGLRASGKPMGGWYDPDGFAAAHPFGQYVSALSRMYAVTGDARFKSKVARLVHGFHETLAPDGYFYASKKVAKEWPCYLYDKNCIGMRDAFTLTGDKEALQVLSRMTDWAVKNLPRRSDEWYTLPENLYDCYALTGERRYLEMAKEYDYSEGFYDAFAQGKNAFTADKHAYSHVNTLCSAARIFKATGDEKYFKALDNAWEFLTTTQMYASGGWGPNERFVEPGKGKLAASLNSTQQGFETPCGSYANVNLDRYMLQFTALGKYGDNMERVLYNGILAALPPLPDGHAFYYSDYRPGASKVRRADRWTCCTGTYAQVTADYPRDIYLHNANDLYVNLFVPSKLAWRRGRELISLVQSTIYPREFSTQLVLGMNKSSRFELHIRVPSWCSKPPNVRVNGNSVANALVRGGFLRLDRIWRKGDVINVEFPTDLRFEAIAPETPGLVALMSGPLLLVAITDSAVELSGDESRPGTWIKRSGSDFATDDGKTIFRPFYLVQGERYTTYCQLR